MKLEQQAARSNAPLLLTPGPLTTSESVKAVMMVDHGTWDDEYKKMTQHIRRQLLELASAEASDFSAVLLQGSGTYGVEATLETIPKDSSATLLIAINGAYGQRMSEIADRIGVKHLDLIFDETEPVDLDKVSDFVTVHPEITHFAVVHGETTTGILNPIETLIPAMVDRNIVTIVDAMSTFGGIPINVNQLNVDYLISSSNKCVQGVPGFSFVIANVHQLTQTAGNARSLSLDLYDQWRCFEDHDGKWRFTSPTHVVYAFEQALLELKQEGGVAKRYQRYSENEARLRQRMVAAGFTPILTPTVQSPVITSFKYPSESFRFRDFYLYLKERGFIIYPGKVSKMNSFRIGNIGEIYPTDIDRLVDLIQAYVSEPVQS
ncbi:2-aminoethylphosphonate--pyruvate transaminase [Secundilactobacillus kimchicus]|uniref:2-aminoethylphosphonate--pyruvate transaminase n=1 Tax=Secundilactobacillus kimchicus TaxID=528209 RepID=UPI0024A979F9|nr:2-aminoethylphosphonate--pyruvate transaminase [Secundilactobacillus kimchicus]